MLAAERSGSDVDAALVAREINRDVRRRAFIPSRPRHLAPLTVHQFVAAADSLTLAGVARLIARLKTPRQHCLRITRRSTRVFVAPKKWKLQWEVEKGAIWSKEEDVIFVKWQC